jgi:hypothetical protein
VVVVGFGRYMVLGSSGIWGYILPQVFEGLCEVSAFMACVRQSDTIFGRA